VDTDFIEAIGIDQAGDGTERQVIAVDRVHRRQRPARLQLDGPEAVELDARLRAERQRRACDLLCQVKAQWRARMATECQRRQRRKRPVPTEAAALDHHIAGQQQREV
jgi:hypothetical protein